MNIIDFLNNPIFEFPIKPARYFPSLITKNLEEYLTLLNEVDDETVPIISKCMPDIQNSCTQIQVILNSYFEGKLLNSYELFSTLIKHCEQYLMPKDKNVVQLDLDTHLFRARSKFHKNIDLHGMLHVPFESRYKIKTQRFSITGLPCLYLSNSIYTCWEELDRPPFSQMAVSRFQTHRKNFKYADLSISKWFLLRSFNSEPVTSKKSTKEEIAELEEILKEAGNFALEKFIQLYPLYLVCYTKVYNPDADFKPEYIFPQLLMQWVANSDDIDGVIYESTKASHIQSDLPYRVNLKGFLNYAIPVKTNNEYGLCSTITEHYKITYPTSWEMLNILDPVHINREIDFKNEILGKSMPPPPIFKINLMGEKPTKYHDTAFGRFEHFLFLKELHAIT